jgi:hypothetical protein
VFCRDKARLVSVQHYIHSAISSQQWTAFWANFAQNASLFSSQEKEKISNFAHIAKGGKTPF